MAEMRSSGMDPAPIAEPKVDIVAPDALSVIQRTELETAMEFAQRYPRSVDRFLKNVRSIACVNPTVAAACTYTLPDRGEGPISGPSVRLAEIVFTQYQNLWGGTRLVDVGDTTLTAMGFIRDLETNTTVAVEVVRGILNRNGQRYKPDMIRVTAMAAMSIAFRNGVFRVVPQALIDALWRETRDVALDKAAGVEKRREDAVAYFVSRKVSYTRIFAALKVEGMKDIGWPEIEILIGIANAVNQNEVSLDEAFPEVPGDFGGTRGINLGTKPKEKEPDKTPEPAEVQQEATPASEGSGAAQQPPFEPDPPAKPTPEPAKADKPAARRSSKRPEPANLGF